MNNQSIRLNKFLAERLGVSRREADELIAAGEITINGKVAVLGDRVTSTGGMPAGGPPNQRIRGKAGVAGPVEHPTIRYKGKVILFETDFLYIAFNKPVGYVCSRRAQGPTPTLYELLPKEYQKLKTVGRLDKDSSGLILLTNDGDFAYEMTHPKFRKNKIYEVELNKPLEPLHQQMISDFGVLLDDGPSRFKVIRKLENSVPEESELKASYTVILTEGRNRQIRRTFAALGYRVTKLHRTQFGKYELADLSPAKYAIIKP